MIVFCDWLHKTIVINVYDSFFRKMISIVHCLLLLSLTIAGISKNVENFFNTLKSLLLGLPPPQALFRANLRAVQICGPLLLGYYLLTIFKLTIMCTNTCANPSQLLTAT